MIETIDITPALTGKHLEALRFQMLDQSHGKPITHSLKAMCDGKMKALFLKAED